MHADPLSTQPSSAVPSPTLESEDFTARQATLILENIGSLLTLTPELGEGPLGILPQAAVVMQSDRVTWVGPQAALYACGLDLSGAERIDAAGALALPGLIDCHTHLVFDGSREIDFEARLSGLTYQQIAAAGGGIARTMRATRAASHDTLLDLGLRRMAQMLEHGITTCEIKSGYGLSLADELKCLEVIQLLGKSQPVSVVSTVLAAHVVPPEFRAHREKYVALIRDRILPEVARQGLAEFCDCFVDEGAFTLEEARAILVCAQGLGFKLKVHAEQLTHTGAAGLAASLGAVSAEHLEHVSDADLERMRDAGTVAVLLPGAAFFLGQDFPKARRFLDAGVEVALATDFNPGSSPTFNLPLMGTFGCVRMGLSVAEAIRAMTVGAARAIGREQTLGRIAPGMQADVAVFSVSDHRSLLYQFGANLCQMVIKDGFVVVP